jgi:poly(3-hydroxybutyrate) depolymerase
MKNPGGIAALIIALMLGATGPARGAGQYLSIDYPASTVDGELQIAVTYTLWIPAGVQTIRGVIVHQHGAGTTAAAAGATAAYDLHWQALAKKWDCALLGPSYHVLNEGTQIGPGEAELWYDPRRGSDKVFLKALDALGAKSGHPEIASVPWCLWGHSGGAQWISTMIILHPDRVVAAWIRSGGITKFHSRHPEWPDHQVTEAVYSVPIMTNAGRKEKDHPLFRGSWIGETATFEEYRPHGAPVGIAPDPLTTHECGDSRYLAIPFFDACLAMRLPNPVSVDQTLKPVDMSTAWLADEFGEVAVPAAEYKGNVKQAVWLPNATVAKAWMQYVKTGTVGDHTPPPAPFIVRVTKGYDGNEIVWEAEADFESGVGGFIVMRNGRGLATLSPKTPADGVFGRPLFQGLSYHDTPEEPNRAMRYVDTTAKPDKKNIYSVVEINSAGIPSKPSAIVTAE